MTPARAAALNAPLRTARLALEPLLAAHADELFEALQDEALYAWISATPPDDREALRARWERLASRRSPDGGAAWLNWVPRRESDGVCLGRIDVEVIGDEAPNVGYVFARHCWGSGYAREALGAVVAHLEARGVRRMVATVTLGNDASCKVLEAAGFTRTRIIPENDTIRGVKHDDIEFVREGRRGP